MPEKHHARHAPGATDSELNLRAVVGFAAGLFAFTVVVLAIMWWMSTLFKAQEQAKDGPPSPLPEARLDPIPPGPRLQSAPPRDMDELRAADQKALTTYGWVDQAGGVAHIPVDRAIAILAARGLPATLAPKKEAK